MSRGPHNIKFILTDLAKEQKEYDLVPLTRKEAAYVMHAFLRTALRGLSEATTQGATVNMSAVMKAFSEIEFDTVWSIAEILFRGAEIKNVVKGKGEITRISDLNDTDYFTENPEELYLALYHGIIANYPKVFSKVRGLLDDLAHTISDRMTGPMSRLETSDTPSPTP